MSKENSKEGSHLSALFQMFAIAVMTVGIYHFAGMSPSTTTETLEKDIVVIDTKRILQAQIDAATESIMNGQEMSPDQLEGVGQQFGISFLEAVRAYSARGTIVLDKQLAIGVPSGTDITDAVADQLGVNLRPIQDPFVTPTVQSGSQ